MFDNKFHNISKKKFTEDEKISLAILSPFFILSLQYITLVVFNLIGSSYASVFQTITKVSVGLIYLFVLPTVFKRNKLELILTYLCVSIVFVLHYTLFAENRSYMMELVFSLFFMCLPAFIYTLSLRDFGVFWKSIKGISYGVFGISLLLGLILIFKFRNIGPYSMTLSYYVLLPALVYLDEITSKFTVIKFINFIISLFIIISLGSRGAIMCIVIFAILKLLKFRSNLTFKKLLNTYALLCMTIVLLINYKNFLHFLNEILLDLNIQSRTVSLFLRDEVHLSGRNELFNQTISAIAENPIFGIGIGGDRLILNGVYVHNIFLEILANYGVAIGGFFIILLCLAIVKSLVTNNLKKYDLIIFWISFGFVHLIVSGSYLIDIRFWILLGLLINLTFKRSIKLFEY